MISLMFMLGVLGLLFVMAYAANRRFGVLGLALAAGSLLSTNFTGLLTPFIQQQGFVLVAPPLSLVVAAGLVLLPPMILLFSGPSYQVTWQRLLGAVGFAVLGFAFLIDPLVGALQLDDLGVTVANFMHKYVSIIVVVGISVAIADMLLTGKPPRKKPGH
ncbi:MAG TPA: hypothetical protein VM581_02120 [Magnetospirillaceae bacterium]|nr:hypothetical protein [Magnetospirillaceae bacterium]